MGKASSSGKLVSAPSGRLRILETTDLHMHLLDYDYFSDRPDPRIGLIRLSHQIAALRTEAGVTTLLCDNGDTLQGNPLADYLARERHDTTPHPMIMALNVLGYDAMTLGNHDFDYGVTFLRKALKSADFPIVSANINVTPAPQITRDFVVLTRGILCDDGLSRPLRIGLTGFAPPRARDWDDKAKNTSIAAIDIVQAARRVVPAIRAAGADIVIALCHTGIGAVTHSQNMENAAVPLAAVDGIDVILTGHTHHRFPDRDIAANTAVDPFGGRLHGKPAVMAGCHGRTLGVVDLSLKWTAQKWIVTDHAVRLEDGAAGKQPSGPLQRKLEKLVATAHAATLAYTQEPIARTALPIHSYFATVQPDLSQQLLGRAAQQAVQAALHGTADAGLPILSADAPYRFGGQGELGHYIDIPAGVIRQRDAAAIVPFADVLCAVRRTGAQIADWLERAAAHYNQIAPGKHDQSLINPLSAGYHCDTILGLQYEIDLTQPARFHPHGTQVHPKTKRIKRLIYKGKDVADDDLFIVAANSFRIKGGSGFARIEPSDIRYVATTKTRDILINYLRSCAEITAPVQQTWSFMPLPDTSAIFQSAPLAKAHLTGNITHIGPGVGGFDSYRITF